MVINKLVLLNFDVIFIRISDSKPKAYFNRFFGNWFIRKTLPKGPISKRHHSLRRGFNDFVTKVHKTLTPTKKRWVEKCVNTIKL